MKYLDFYNECMKTKSLPKDGLCLSLPTRSIRLIKPTKEDLNQLKFEKKPESYWANGKIWKNIEKREKRTLDFGYYMQEFTPLRQTLVLLLAAINDEL